MWKCTNLSLGLKPSIKEVDGCKNNPVKLSITQVGVFSLWLFLLYNMSIWWYKKPKSFIQHESYLNEIKCHISKCHISKFKHNYTNDENYHKANNHTKNEI